MLSPVHMSGDEAPNARMRRRGIFIIIEAEWQSVAFKTFVRTLDQLYIDQWDAGNGTGKRSGRGPRERIAQPDGKKSKDTAAPCGLWRNCYNPAWLSKQTEWAIYRLGIIDEDYDFTIDCKTPQAPLPETEGLREELREQEMACEGDDEDDGGIL